MEEFLTRLEQALRAAHVPHPEEIIEKYRRRVALAHEADMTDEETLRMFGKIEDIVDKYRSSDSSAVAEIVTPNDWTFSLEDAYADTITLHRSQASGISYIVPNSLKEKLKVSLKEKEFSLADTDKGITRIIRSPRGEIIVNIGPDVSFDRFYLSTVSGKVDLCSLNANQAEIRTVSGRIAGGHLFADTVRIHTVSGTAEFSGIHSRECRLSTVSGDYTVRDICVDDADFETINGDIEMTGRILSFKASTLNGHILLNEKKISPSLADRFNGMFQKKEETDR